MIGLITNITSGIGSPLKYRYIYSNIEGYSEVYGNAGKTRIKDWRFIGGISVPRKKLEEIPEEIREIIISSKIVCYSIVLADLFTVYDINVITKSRSIVSGKIGFVIDYELARREDELFLLV